MKFKKMSIFKNFFNLKYLLWVICFVYSASFSYANDKNHQNSLDKIRVKVQEAEANLNNLELEISKLNGEISNSDNELVRIKREREKITQIREKNQVELKSVEDSIQGLRKEALLLVKRSKGRLKALYRERPVQDLLSFLFSDKNNNGSRIAFYVAKIRNYDKKLMVKLISIRRDFAIKAERQKRIIAENLELEDKLIVSQHEEQRQNVKKKEMLSMLSKKESLIEKELNELRAQALRIETVLKSVTNGEDLYVDDNKYKEKDKDKKEIKKVTPFNGKGLAAKKGKLPLPVNGRIVKNFGRHRVKNFKDYVVRNGVEFAVSNGAQAFAVASGKVIYEGKMPGYGNMIILDHGERYYTLYSHLANINVGLGDVLSSGDLVGVCESGQSGGSFYFEIRKDGKPVEPTLYLEIKKDRKLVSNNRI